MEQFSQYGMALVSIGVFVIIVLMMSPLVAIRKSAAGLTAGSNPPGDYDNPTYRLNRAYLNATEITGPFVGATGAAMLAGASPFWVNLLAGIFVIGRVVNLAVHVGGLKPMDIGPRTFSYVIGWACCILLALMAVFAAI